MFEICLQWQLAYFILVCNICNIDVLVAEIVLSVLMKLRLPFLLMPHNYSVHTPRTFLNFASRYGKTPLMSYNIISLTYYGQGSHK